MFAVVRTGGKQYRVAAGDKIAVEKLAGAAGDTITLGDVLLAGEGDRIDDAASVTVSAEIIAQAKSEKVFVFKKRRRHNYRRKNGHRQQMTLLRITAVGDDRGEQRAAAAEGKTPATKATGADTAVADAPVTVAQAPAESQAAPVKATKKATPVKDTSEEKASPKARKAAPKKDGAAAAKADDKTVTETKVDDAANTADEQK